MPPHSPKSRSAEQPGAGGQDRFLTIPQVAELTQQSERSVWQQLKDGKLPGVRFGNQWRVLESLLFARALKESERRHEHSNQ